MEESAPQEVREIRQVVQEVSYEKVEADSNGIFRYEMTLSPDGVLKVTIDDVPKENRHLTKSEKLSEQSLKELNEILDFDALRKIDREYAGVESEPPKLESWNLKVVYTSRVRSVSIVNTREPEAFKAIREKLEAFSKNQLGIWAIQYSREKLIELVGEVGRRFRTEERWARTARIKIRDYGFNTITRQTSFDAPARDDITFREKALALFDRETIGSVRLIGFGVTNIQDAPDTDGPSLFPSPNDERRLKRERLSAALDNLRDRGLMG
jgi:hypothetical protein